MRNKKIGWIIVFILVFFSFLYEIFIFSITQKIKEELSKNEIKVKHVSVNIFKGKIKLKKGEGKKGKIKWKFSKLEANFSPFEILKTKKIDKVIIEDWKVIVKPLSLPDPNTGWIKEVTLKKGNFVILLPKANIEGNAWGKIENIGKGRTGKMNLKGEILPHSPFWIKGEFKMPDLGENSKGKGEINNFSFKGFSGDLSFESEIVKNNLSFNALFDGKKGKIKIQGKGKIPEIQFSFKVEGK